MEQASTAYSLHLHSGIPVVALLGDWSDETDGYLAETVAHLVGSGHLEIVINLARAKRLPYPERAWLDGLERLASAVQGRHGRLDIVASEQLTYAGLGESPRSFLRWANSETEAVCRIKGVPCFRDGEKLPLRLV